VIEIEIEQFQQPVSQLGGRTGIDGSNSSGRWRGVRPIISAAPHLSSCDLQDIDLSLTGSSRRLLG